MDNYLQILSVDFQDIQLFSNQTVIFLFFNFNFIYFLFLLILARVENFPFMLNIV